MPNEQLVVQLEARIRDFERQMQRATAVADRQVAKIERRFLDMNPRLASVGRGFFKDIAIGAAGVLAPVLSVRAAVNGAKDALKEFGDVSDNAKASGLDAETFQELAYAAQLGGVEFDAFSGALATFNKNAGLATVGKGRMTAALKALNPELLKSLQATSDQSERFRLVADAIDKESDASKKAAIATAVFGDAGAKLVGILTGGSRALDKTAEKARKLGLIVDNELIARADTLGDEFDTATKVLDLQFKQILLELAPILTATAGAVGDLARALRGLSGAAADPFAGVSTDELQRKVSFWQEALDKQRKLGSQLGQGRATNELAAVQAEIDRRNQSPTGVKLQAFDRSLLDNPPPAVTPPLSTRNDAATSTLEQADAVKELINNLKAEQAQVGMTSTQQAVANALRQAGTRATAAQKAEIEAIIVATDAHKAALERDTEAMQQFADISRDALGGFLSDLAQGKTLAESLGDVLGNLGNRLLNAGLDSLFSPTGVNLFGLPKRERGGPVNAGQPYLVGEKRPEVFVPNTAGRIVPRAGDLKAGGGGGNVTVNFAPVIDARGADEAGLARVERQLARLKSEIPTQVVATVRTARKRRML